MNQEKGIIKQKLETREGNLHMNKHERELEPFLPNSGEIDEMGRADFLLWIGEAFHTLPQREIERDPLFHLKKRISQILACESKSEVEKEKEVFNEIRRYYKRINQ
ncbi:hypothetical protein ABNF65_16945 [Paenibacillus larvae]